MTTPRLLSSSALKSASGVKSDIIVLFRIGLGGNELCRVYICPARRGGKSLLQADMVEELLESGEEVRVVLAADRPKEDIDVKKLEWTIRDLDLCIESIWEKLIDDYIYNQFRQELMKSFVIPESTISKPEYKIIPRPDTYIYSPKIHCEWLLRNIYFPEVFKVKDEIDEPDPLWTKKGE